MVTHPLETLGGIAKLAGVVVIGGYAAPGGGIMAQQNRQSFDKIFGTNLADVDAGVKQSLSETWDTLQHGSDFEQGEIVGQAIEFIAEIAVGTKGAGAALKSVKAGSMGSKMAKIAGIADKVGDILKATGGKLKKWTLGKLKNAKKGIFGKKKSRPKLPENATNKQKGNFGEMVSRDNLENNPALKEKGYDLERIGKDAPSGLDDKIQKGIDGIYKNNTPPPEYVIDEAKFGSSQLSTTKNGTKQMSDDWVKQNKRLENQVGRDEAKKIKDAMQNGEVEKVVSKVEPDGTVKTYKVDAKGNIGNPWP